MKKISSRVESYVPVESFYDGKREAAGKIFRDRFAVVDMNADFSVLAFRGENLQIGEPLALEDKETNFLKFSIARGKRVLAKTADGSALFFGDWALEGLVPVLLLQESCADLSAAANLLLYDRILLLEKQEKSNLSKRELNNLCLHFSETLADCDRVFDEQNAVLFRRHAARIAAFAGCRADFSFLPFDSFALSATDLKKWTLLLLCLFLSLRGMNGEEPTLTLRETGRETLLSALDFAPAKDAEKQIPQRLSFLRHPAFANVEAEPAKEGFRFSVILSQASKPGELRAFSQAMRFCFVLETNNA